MLAILPAYRRLQQPCEGSVDGATQAQDITVQRHVWRTPHEVRPLQCPTVDLKQKNMWMKINWSICSWSIWGLLDLFSMREVKFITWWMTPKCNMLYQALCIISKPSVNSNWSYTLEMSNSGQNWWSCDLEIWWMTLKNNTIMAPHLWIQSGVRSPEMNTLGQNLVWTLWPWVWC